MNRATLLGTIIRSTTIVLIAASTSLYAQDDIERVFVFGDSLSDAGNIYALTGETSKAPYAPIPTFPYVMGGHHYSNGRTWAESLAQSLGDPAGGKASWDAPGKNGNYAHGGSRARSGSGSTSPSALDQVGQFLSDFGAVPANSLIVIEFGGNDIRDALVAGASDPTAVGPILTAAVNDTATAIQALYAAGGRHFMVANAPNLAHAPVVQLSGAAAAAGFLVGQYNAGLEGALQALEFYFADIEIERLELGTLIDGVVANPGQFGFTNVTSPCLAFLVEFDAKCDNPESTFFWDGLHPTVAGHAVLVELALTVLED